MRNKKSFKIIISLVAGAFIVLVAGFLLLNHQKNIKFAKQQQEEQQEKYNDYKIAVMLSDAEKIEKLVRTYKNSDDTDFDSEKLAFLRPNNNRSDYLKAIEAGYCESLSGGLFADLYCDKEYWSLKAIEKRLEEFGYFVEHPKQLPTAKRTLAEYPDFSPLAISLIMQNKINPLMNIEEVKVSWGTPDNQKKTNNYIIFWYWRTQPEDDLHKRDVIAFNLSGAQFYREFDR